MNHPCPAHRYTRPVISLPKPTRVT
jgi:hypothetical protein